MFTPTEAEIRMNEELLAYHDAYDQANNLGVYALDYDNTPIDWEAVNKLLTTKVVIAKPIQEKSEFDAEAFASMF